MKGSGALLDIAVIGAGRIGRIHARNVALHPRARLVGVTDPDARAAAGVAQALGSEVISLDDAFGAKAVLICSPTPTHAGYIERAATAGQAVFCEKPVDLDATRVRDCLEVVRRAGVPLMVGFNRRFDPSFASLRRRLEQGEIGTLEMLTITSRDPSPPPATYAAQSGGIFRDMAIHDLDMARFLLREEPTKVYAVGSSLVDPEIGRAGDYDTAAITLKTASGAICQIGNSRRATYGYDQRIELHGSVGLLRAGNATATTVEAAGSGGFRTDTALPFFLERYAAAYQAELDAFIAAVLDGTPAAPTGEDGLRALLLADAATESARTGLPVRV
ncbi:inositol 2-dehydrogenase [Roseomonas sp. CCTCC AB2023176]|uniref:inositol 2-dehydrogenase n=1 Tax=Roseomonas sp. CCTCC AB2023176 TaxID=3342640 RepID=UPI0035D8E3EC